MFANNRKDRAKRGRESTSGQQPLFATAASTAHGPSGSLFQPFSHGSLCVNNAPLAQTAPKQPPQPERPEIHEDLLRADGKEGTDSLGGGDNDSG